MKRIFFSLALAILAAALPTAPARAQFGNDNAGSDTGSGSNGNDSSNPDNSGSPDSKDATPKRPEDMDPNELAADFDTITYWKAELPGGTYLVAHDSINGVSSQEYVLDGAARVTEVNISTAGVMQPRFYYIEPLTPKAPASAGQSPADHAKSAIEEAASRLLPGDPVWAKVIKEYPTTTHAGTIEYRLETKDQIQRLYESLERSWLRGKSEVFRPEGAGRFDPKDEKKKKKDGEDGSEEGDGTNADNTTNSDGSSGQSDNPVGY